MLSNVLLAGARCWFGRSSRCPAPGEPAPLPAQQHGQLPGFPQSFWEAQGGWRAGWFVHTECRNYVRVLQQLNETFLYVCGTNAFQPTCDYLNLISFELGGKNEDGKGRCPFDPAQSYTSVMNLISFELGGKNEDGKGRCPFDPAQSYTSVMVASFVWISAHHFVTMFILPKNQAASLQRRPLSAFLHTEIRTAAAQEKPLGAWIQLICHANCWRILINLLSILLRGKRYLYAGSNSGVVQSPVAFCDKYTTCVDCVLARDPYCAWKPLEASCVDILQESEIERDWIQNIGGDASSCSDKVRENSLQHTFKHGSTAELKCSQKSNLAQVVWKFKDDVLKVESPKYRLLEKALLIFNLSEGDSGVYQCLSEEKVKNKKFSQVLAKHVLELKKIQHATVGPTVAAAMTEGNRDVRKVSAVSTSGSTAQTSTTQIMPVTTARLITKPIGPVLTSAASNTEIFNLIPDAVPEKTMFLKSNDNFLLMFLFLFFFILFLCLLSYNCYKGYLPGQCLKFRSVMLLGKKKTKSDFSDCEQSVKETLVEQGSVSHQNGEQPKPAHDTGYETEPDCGNGQVQPGEPQAFREVKDKPFDVKCELKYADSDAEGD
nr:PREDICTED: semaphorin-4D-like [Apteryx mantelli mantelli]